MPRLVAAPDKLRGTATAAQAADAIARAARRGGWEATVAPMSDGGEGFCETMGGTPVAALVRGPLGAPVEARFTLRHDGAAVVESSAAAGRHLLVAPRGSDPLDATTYGVGELLCAAIATGATSIVVGCGGSATTDGGAGCLAALDDRGVRLGIPITVACDVQARFLEAPSRFGPQKGATVAQVAELEARLAALADRYRVRFGVDVTAWPGSGAAGGLAGALAALGGTLVEGARLVARERDLAAAIRDADLVVTGEGRLDRSSLEGKVVGVVLGVDDAVPALVVAGTVEADAAAALAAARRGPTRVVALDPERQRALGTLRAIEDAVLAALDGVAR